MNIYLDLETIPTTNLEERRHIADAVRPPGSVKKPDSIAKWYEEHGAEAAEEAIHKTGLDGTWGEIVVVAFAVDHQSSVEVFDRDGLLDTEAALLKATFDRMRTLLGGAMPHWVGHNVEFDLRFLYQRAVVNQIRPTGIYIPYNAKPWSSYVTCTMHEWGGTDPRNRKSLTELCRAFGIKVDDEIDGSQVAAEWASGNRQKVIDHCIADVERVRQIHRRMRFEP